jgi:uncharacterized protein (DUF2344 family)
MKIRMAYSKKASARYIAHLDLARLFQRAFRRGSIELIYSEGFNPHPKISFGAPLPVGMEGEREYVDVEIKDLGFEDLQDAFIRLNSQMPAGIELLSCQILPKGAKKLMVLLDTAVYRVEVPWGGTDVPDVPDAQGLIANAQASNKYNTTSNIVDAAHIENTIRDWLAKDEILWDRRKEKKVISLNIRPFIRSLTVTGIRPLGCPLTDGLSSKSQSTAPQTDLPHGQIADFEIVTVLGNAGSVRPLEILGAFCRDTDCPMNLKMVHVKRTGVYWLGADGEHLPPDAF